MVPKLKGQEIDSVPTPVPLSATLAGLVATLADTVSPPLRSPVAVGVKLTAMLQLPPLASDPIHGLLCEKSPLVLIWLTVTAAPVLLVRVTVCAALVVFTP